MSGHSDPERRQGDAVLAFWSALGTRFLPFADAASEGLPMARLMRLSLFQVSVGMVAVLLTGTLNRVMIVELGVPSALVGLMVALPLVFAPLRALIGHRSDTHRSWLGWRRTPYVWFGGLLQFGGLAIMPFALLLLTGQGALASEEAGMVAGALAFLLVGAGMHTAQTAGLALAGDLADDATRPRVVALLYVMLLVGMGLSALVFGLLLADFSALRLVQVVQGAGVVALGLNLAALWKQEPRNRALSDPGRVTEGFASAFGRLTREMRVRRLLTATGLGAAAFGMQDVLLEPYGGQVLGMGVGATTLLSAVFALGGLCGFGLAARQLSRGVEPHRLAGLGGLAGIVGFAMVVFAGPLASVALFATGIGVVSLGGGLFAVSTLTAMMALAKGHDSGLALGAWGAVQASAAGVAVAAGAGVRDLTAGLAQAGVLGPALTDISVGYTLVYHLEILLLFATLAAIGPLARHALEDRREAERRFGLPMHPG
jgi:BCD family chlorophyll transporter-like MFS transporter